MCGFVGFTAVDFDEGVNRAIVKDMADRIIHRGPDDEGFFVNDDVAMGFRRLSIIDLEGSHQPMQNADGSVTVTFNGEIYNFQELRAELEGMGLRAISSESSRCTTSMRAIVLSGAARSSPSWHTRASRRSSTARPCRSTCASNI